MFKDEQEIGQATVSKWKDIYNKNHGKENTDVLQENVSMSLHSCKENAIAEKQVIICIEISKTENQTRRYCAYELYFFTSFMVFLIEKMQKHWTDL